NQTVTLTPTKTFSAGEIVTVNLSHDVQAADDTFLRSAGFAFQFTISAHPGARTFQFLNAMSNRTSPGTNTRIYGAQGTDLNGVAVLDVDGDGDWDIVDANVDDNDLALMLNDGSGHFGDPIRFDGGVNGEYGITTGDMNNDGIIDLIVGARNGEEIRTLLGNG